MTTDPGGSDPPVPSPGGTTCVCEPPAGGGAPSTVLAVARPAAATEVPGLRRIIRSWVREIGLDEDRAEDLVLAADEAISNVVDHAYPDAPGTLRLRAGPRGCGNGVVVAVTDDGDWRVPGDPGSRGRGLLLIRNLADRTHISHGPTGTTVRMCWAR